MKNKSIIEIINIWKNVFVRIHYFKSLYPLSSIIKDIFLFPLDYYSNNKDIKTIRNLTIVITNRCNIRCQMCYFHNELKNRYLLPFEQYKQVIDAVSSSRPCVILTGGEPFTHPRLLDMVAYAKFRYLPVQIFTNGTLLKPAYVDKLVDLGLDYINFTLLGNEISHPMVALVPKSYDLFIENLAYFAAHRGKTKIVLNYTITPQSFNDIEHAVKVAKQYKLDGIRFQHYNFLHSSEIEAQENVMKRIFNQSISLNEIQDESIYSEMAMKILAFIKGLKEESVDIPIQWAPTLTELEILNWYSSQKFDTQRKCLYPWRGILVDADGKIYPCSKIYLPLGDLNQEDVYSVWNSEDMKFFRKHLRQKLFPACSRCCKL